MTWSGNRPKQRIYFLRPVGMDGPIKVGCSALSHKRLYMMALWSPFPLEIVAEAPGNFDMEWGLHWLFKKDRLHHEWFRASPALLAIVNGLRAGKALSDLVNIPERKERIKAARALKKAA